MKGLYATFITEIIKAGKAKILWISILFFIFLGIIIGLLMFISKHPEIAGKSVLLNTKASLIGKGDWPTYLNLLIQMVLTIGSIGSGIVTIWVFGREYTDRVLKDLLALPVSRHTFVLTKFIIIVIWTILLLFLLFVTALLGGIIVNLEDWSWVLIRNYFTLYMVSGLLTILLCTPVAFITCLSRGFLLPVAFVFLTLILTQFIFAAIPAIVLFIPWAIPALYSGVAGSGMPNPGLISYSILCITSIAGLIGTAAWWQFADQK